MSVVTWLHDAAKKLLWGRAESLFAPQEQGLLSSRMAAQIEQWYQIFEGRPAWKEKKRKLVGTAAFSTAYLARLVNAELKVQISGSERAAYLDERIQSDVLPKLVEKTQLAMVGGQIVMKPFVQDGCLAVEYIRANDFLPVKADYRGTITAAVFFERACRNDKTYIRTEYHRLEKDGYIIENRAFVSQTGTLGKEVPLSMVPEWEQLEPVVVLKEVKKPLFSCFQMPFANNIETSSPLPVSLYANAVGTLEDIDRMYTDYCYEFSSARRKVYVDETAFRLNPQTGKPEYPDDDLFIGIASSSTSERLHEDYTPEIRESAFQAGLNRLLRIYEIQTGVSTGTYSFDAQTGAITATQVISQDRATFYTVRAIQEMGRTALINLIEAMDVYTTLYNLAPAGKYNAVILYGDGIFEDTSVEFERREKMVSMGMRPELLLAWYFGVNEQSAREMLTGDKTQKQDEAQSF